MPVLLVGCGRMGSAMARGWEGAGDLFVFDPGAASLPAGAERVISIDAVEGGPDWTVVLAVKPQTFASLGEALQPLASRGALFVSIMAGVTLAGLSAQLGGTQRIVRAMPNTPAAIGRGITVAVAGADAGARDRAVVDALLAPTGALLWLGDERQLDAVTAVSGSGPAYFFRFAEELAAAGARAGLPDDLAMQLARATFTGAAALAEAEAASLAALRQQVTSPGGTTAAGIAAMEAGGALARLLDDVVGAAAERSRALAGEGR